MRIPSKPLLSLTALLVSLVSVDLALRKVLPIPEKGYGVWAAYPASELEMVSRPDGVRTIHRYNALGFRGEGFVTEPRHDVRIIAVGDSFTEGTGVQEDATWPAFLDRALADEGDIEVLNLGDGGSGPDRYAEIIAQVAIALKPNQLIVSLLPSDFRFGLKLPKELGIRTELPDPFREQRTVWQKPLVFAFPSLTYLVERGLGKWPVQRGLIWTGFDETQLDLATERVARLEGLSIDRARAVVDRRLARLDPLVVAAAREREFNPALLRLALSDPWNYKVTTKDMDVSVEELSSSTREWLDWFGTVSKSRGIQPWILYYPQPTLIVEGPWGLFLESEFEKPSILGDTSIRDLLEAECDALGIRFIDATPILRANASPDLYLRYDTHPTAKANKLMADVIADQIRPVLRSEPSR